MKKFMHGVFPLILALLLGPLCFAQDQLSEGEQKELGAALSEAGNSPVEFARILEQHSEKVPRFSQKGRIGAYTRQGCDRSESTSSGF